ncbi:acetolactate decarboxylase [Lactobacillus taiwanensis]|uniref:acetolactate decarboxylase n=1 Tax=Lactobacillus taiwanensis TaxID=508451 RepID=UPI00211B2B88|nr:acetolactate decarboxylase [Lactobacillus taiwanensis]
MKFSIHFEEIKDSFKVKNLTQKELEDRILADYPYKNVFFTVKADYPYKNVFFTVKIVETFSTVKTRVVEKQSRPYKTLLQVADEQAVFESTDVSSTAIGYFALKMFQGMAAAGYHLHFLADNKSIGGENVSDLVESFSDAVLLIIVDSKNLIFNNCKYYNTV